MIAKENNEQDKSIRVYSYLRFSTPRQLEGHSQQRQLERSREWCESNNAELVEEMQDLGVSAFRGKNRMIGVLARFLDLVRAGEIPAGSYLIVEDIDRLTREKVMKALSLYLDIIQAGITIVTLVDEQVHSEDSIELNPMILQMAIASMCRANGESVRKSDLIGARWAASRKLALEGKPSPMGRLPCWLKRDEDTREPVLLPTAEVVRRMYELAATGMKVFSITRTLNEEKIPPLTTRGKSNHWSTSSVRKILQAKSACGTLVVNEPYMQEVTGKNGKKKQVKRYRKAGEVEDYYPAAVSKELFAAVATIFRANSSRAMQRQGGSKASTMNAFSGLIREMGSGGGVRYTYNLVTPKNGKKRRQEYLRAHRSTTAGLGYSSFSWNYLDFQDIFVAVCRLALKGSAKTSEAESKLRILYTKKDDMEEERSNLIEGLSTAKAGHAFIASSIDEKTKTIQDLHDQIESLRQEIRLARQTRDSLPKKIDDRVELRRILRSNVRLVEVDFDEKRFTCELFSGISYEVTLSRENRLYVTTDDFEIPADAFQDLVIRQGWHMRERRFTREPS